MCQNKYNNTATLAIIKNLQRVDHLQRTDHRQRYPPKTEMYMIDSNIKQRRQQPTGHLETHSYAATVISRTLHKRLQEEEESKKLDDESTRLLHKPFTNVS